METSRSALGTTITTATIEELPIAGRNFASLSQLTPGVTSTAGAVAGQRGGFSVDAIKEFIVVSNSSGCGWTSS